MRQKYFVLAHQTRREKYEACSRVILSHMWARTSMRSAGRNGNHRCIYEGMSSGGGACIRFALHCFLTCCIVSTQLHVCWIPFRRSYRGMGTLHQQVSVLFSFLCWYLSFRFLFLWSNHLVYCTSPAFVPCNWDCTDAAVDAVFVGSCCATWL